MPSIRRNLQITLSEGTYEQLLRHIGARHRSAYIESLIIDHLMIGDTKRTFMALAMSEKTATGLPFCSRGQVWSIADKSPLVVVSAEMADQALDRVQVVPLVEPAMRAEGARVSLTVGLRRYDAAPDQLSTIPRSSLRELHGVLSTVDMGALEPALRTEFDLWASYPRYPDSASGAV